MVGIGTVVLGERERGVGCSGTGRVSPPPPKKTNEKCDLEMMETASADCTEYTIIDYL